MKNNHRLFLQGRLSCILCIVATQNLSVCKDNVNKFMNVHNQHKAEQNNCLAESKFFQVGICLKELSILKTNQHLKKFGAACELEQPTQSKTSITKKAILNELDFALFPDPVHSFYSL